MKEIKFRGKPIEEENYEFDWVEGFYMKELGGHYILFPIGQKIQVIPETVGQFIGTLDKNDKKIYEGDIIKRNSGEKYIVRWNNKYSKFEMLRIKDNYPLDFFELFSFKEKIEVIGDIY